MPASTELDAAVALDHLAGDEAVAGDEGDGIGNVLGLAGPTGEVAERPSPGKGPAPSPPSGGRMRWSKAAVGVRHCLGKGRARGGLVGDRDLDPGLDLILYGSPWYQLLRHAPLDEGFIEQLLGALDLAPPDSGRKSR